MSDLDFRVWGSRGGRNTYGSRIGNLTSCYSLRAGADLYVFDAGRGLLALADAVLRDAAFGGVARVHALVTHGHMDHWEGLKDAPWLWTAGQSLAVELIGPAEAIAAIQRAHEPPSFVPLEVLARGTLARFEYLALAARAIHRLPNAALETIALHHYSGIAPDERYLETLGYQLSVDAGPTVAYLCDHEPTPATRAAEDALLARSHLAVIDASYGEIREHAFGHGSVEYAADLARAHPNVLVIAAHHGPTRTDDAIEASVASRALPNLAIARDGARFAWTGRGFAAPG